MKSSSGFSFSVALLAATAGSASAQVLYTGAGVEYSQNFDSLPNDLPNNATIQPVYTAGWSDNSTPVAGTSVGVTGWYLYHSEVPPAPSTGPTAGIVEGGANGHQRLRSGAGNNTTGSFWLFGSDNTTAGSDRALGSLSSNTTQAVGTDSYIALRLRNDTGSVLTSFTVKYDAEQWRDGGAVDPDGLAFAHSTTAIVGDWNTTAVFTAETALNFTPPVNGAAAAAVDGNTAGRVGDITATVNGVSWLPGEDLWLRFSDRSITGADDGIAIDNFRFTASVPEPSGAVLGVGAVVCLALRRRCRA